MRTEQERRARGHPTARGPAVIRQQEAPRAGVRAGPQVCARAERCKWGHAQGARECDGGPGVSIRELWANHPAPRKTTRGCIRLTERPAQVRERDSARGEQRAPGFVQARQMNTLSVESLSLFSLGQPVAKHWIIQPAFVFSVAFLRFFDDAD